MITICPAVMLAKSRTVRANGLITNPINSIGHKRKYIRNGTPLGTMPENIHNGPCIIVPITIIPNKVKNAIPAVTARLPVEVAKPGINRDN